MYIVQHKLREIRFLYRGHPIRELTGRRGSYLDTIPAMNSLRFSWLTNSILVHCFGEREENTHIILYPERVLNSEHTRPGDTRRMNICFL